ncbi:M48 family metallopeptidase [Sporosarcina sp. NPDC096371]|uniref:M48 family metallopeptidase n=1 Tax=Sporosarcina sp. NPDC096371 TaxID=3364530 RepID=UPI00381D67D7
MSLKSLTSSKETPYFICSVIISIFIYLIAMVSLIGIVIALVILAFILFSNAIMLGSIRGNGIRISERQFPDVYERVVDLSKKMELKSVPDVFVIHSEGAFNAFATRFFGRNMVVIYSEVFELAREQGDKELDFIIAHELAHIKRRHILNSMLVLPATLVPFLSQAYSRACEYTCDRQAAYYIQDGLAAKRALTILGIGKGLYKEVNDFAYLEQIHSESNVAVWFAEVLSTHPLLPKRIQAVGHFMDVEGTPNFAPKNGKIAIGATIYGAVFSALYVGVIVLITTSSVFLASFLPADDELGSPEDLTPLMMSVIDDDITAAKDLLMDGVDIHEKDGESTTALHYAVYNDNIEAVQFLLDVGADPNDSDDYSTVLATALYNESYDIAALLYDAGADPTTIDAYGDSALDYFEVTTKEEFEEALNDMD